MLSDKFKLVLLQCADDMVLSDEYILYQWPIKNRFINILICSCNFCVKGLQCVLSTVGVPSSILLQAVRTVSETAQKQSEYIVYWKRFCHFIGQICIGPCCIFQVYVRPSGLYWQSLSRIECIKHSYSHPTEWEISALQGYPYIKLRIVELCIYPSGERHCENVSCPWTQPNFHSQGSTRTGRSI